MTDWILESRNPYIATKAMPMGKLTVNRVGDVCGAIYENEATLIYIGKFNKTSGAKRSASKWYNQMEMALRRNRIAEYNRLTHGIGWFKRQSVSAQPCYKLPITANYQLTIYLDMEGWCLITLAGEIKVFETLKLAIMYANEEVKNVRTNN